MKFVRQFSTVAAGLLAMASIAGAQGSGTISGRVLTAAGAPLPSASVSIQNMGLGAYTDASGQYRIVIPQARLTGQTVTVTARRVGYLPRSIQVTLSTGLNAQQDFPLTAAPTQLTGVVVTALCLQRQKSTLGTAQQQVDAQELNRTPTMNVVNALSGKVSGVNIQGSGVQGGSTSIVIRGQNSITGNNQPLYIVDGVPLVDFNRGGNPGGGGLLGGTPPQDFGSSINDLDPDDIASVTVLKGPNASAIYGSRASNGVILITTKHGEATSGKVNTTITASYSFDSPSKLPDYQNVYGQGSGGEFAFVDGLGDGIHDDLDQSFGPKMDGRLIPQFTSPVGPDGKLVPTPFVPHPNNVSDFFNTGTTFDGNVAFSGGTDRANARLALGTQRVNGIVPSNSFQKFSGALTGDFRPNKRLSTSGTLQYLRDQAQDRPGVGYTNSILEQFIWFGRQVDMSALKDYAVRPNQVNANPQWLCNNQYNWNCNFHNNPYWLQIDNPEHDSRDNIIASGQATYTLLPWLDVRLQSGSNIFRFNSDIDAAGGNVQQGLVDPNWNGGFNFYNTYYNENNTQLLFTANKQAGSALALNAVLGGNVRKTSNNNASQGTTGILAPGIYNVANAAISPTITNYSERRQVNSIFGSASFTLNNWWTVEGTARNDWSSTLPKGNNSYFYPSVNTAIVLSNAIPALGRSFLNYLKIFGSVAEVGSDAGAYQLQTTYSGSSNKFGGQPLFTYSNSLANANLKPEITHAYEGGIEVGLFNNRITGNASWYRKETMNQIINLPVASASGFQTIATNAGEVVNAGIDGTITVVPIDRGENGLRWTSTFNYSHNQSMVAKLIPGVSTLQLGSQWSTITQARVGYPYGEFFGYPYARDSAGNILTGGGYPDFGSPTVLGNIQPRWTGGWSNEFRYKRITFSGLFDFHVGGDIFSISNMFGNYAGVFKQSLQGREVDWNKPGIVVKGVDDVTGKPNTDTLTAEQYWQGLFELSQAWIYKDTWVKLRELRLGVDLPDTWAHRFNVSAINVAFIGRNLWLVTSGVPNIDPEVNYSTGNNTQGFEFAPLPNPRSIGVNLRITP